MIVAIAASLCVFSLGLALLKVTGRCRTGWGLVAMPALAGMALVAVAFGAFLALMSTVATALSRVL